MVFKFMKVGGIAKGVSKGGEEGQSLSTGVFQHREVREKKRYQQRRGRRRNQ